MTSWYWEVREKRLWEKEDMVKVFRETMEQLWIWWNGQGP